METNFNTLNSTFADWQSEVLKPVPIHYQRTHIYIESKLSDISLSDINGCYHENYYNRTWLSALENLKRFKFNSETLNVIKNSIITAKLIGDEIYIFDHHRPIIARFLGVETIKANLAIYKPF